MKLILENWRKFLNESIEENLSKLGLHMEQTNYGYNIAIMDVSDMSKYPKVIGMIETVKSEKPCIPKTHEIGTVATHPSVRGSSRVSLPRSSAPCVRPRSGRLRSAGSPRRRAVSTRVAARPRWIGLKVPP